MEDSKQQFIILGSIFVVLISIVLLYSNTKKDNSIKKDQNNTSDTYIKEEVPEETNEDLTGDVNYDLDDYNISRGGSYNLEGSYGCIRINTKKDVVLNLNNTTIACSGGPGINVLSNNKVSINIKGNNRIDSSTIEESDGAIYSNDNLLFSGDGVLTINSNIDGIVSKKKIVVKDGTYIINSLDDGIRGKDSIELTNTKLVIKSSGDAIKSSNKNNSSKGYIIVNNGTYNINSDGDAFSSTNYVKINDGIFNIRTANGSEKRSVTSAKGIKASKNIIINKGTFTFDTSDDSIHSNGNININGGSIEIQTGDDAIHSEKDFEITNGELNITKCFEGIEGQTVTIKGGNINIISMDDGINAVHPTLGERDSTKSSKVLFTGGITKIKAMSDGIDSNGIIQIDNGEVYIESSSTASETSLDHDGELIVNGGTLVAVSNIEGVDTHGEMKSKVPMLVARIRGTSHKIILGNIIFDTSLSNYRFMIIASDKIEPGENKFVYDDNERKIKIYNGVSEYLSHNYRRK